MSTVNHWKAFLIILAVMASFSLRAATFSQRNLPAFNSHSDVTFITSAQDLQTAGTDFNATTHRPVSLTKIFVESIPVESQIPRIPQEFSSVFVQTPSSYIQPTSSRPPSC